MRIGEAEKELPIAENAMAVTFTVQLKAGPTTLQTWFLDDEGAPDRARGAYYVYVTRR